MTVSEQRIQKQSKKYKKMFEMAYPFYPYKTEDETYLLIRYSRFNKETGNIITTSDGEVVSRSQAIPVFKAYRIYDSYILDCRSKLSNQKEFPVTQPEQLQHLLNTVLKPIADEVMNTPVKQDMDTVLLMTNAYLKSKDRFQTIFQETVEMDKEVQEIRGYLTPEDVKRAADFNKEWELLTFDSLRKDRDALPAYERLQSFCEDHREKVEETRPNASKELQQILANFTNAETIASLHKSLKGFEVDETEKQAKTFAVGEKGLEEFAENYDRTVEYKFKTLILPFLRNT